MRLLVLKSNGLTAAVDRHRWCVWLIPRKSTTHFQPVCKHKKTAILTSVAPVAEPSGRVCLLTQSTLRFSDYAKGQRPPQVVPGVALVPALLNKSARNQRLVRLNVIVLVFDFIVDPSTLDL